jgi:O-antigen/teichoic acid export membrane protein
VDAGVDVLVAQGWEAGGHVQGTVATMAPRLGAALGRGDLAEARHYYRTSTAWLVLITWPLFLLCVVFGERLLSVFGRGYQSGADVVLLLSLSMLVATGCGMVDMVLNMAGRTSWNMWNVVLSMGVQMGLDVLLIPRQGIFGAAIGWAVAIVLANLVPLAQIGFVMGLHPFGRATVLAGSVTVGCFGLVPVLARQVFGPSWAGLLVSAVVGLLLYVPLLWRLRDTLELTALRGIRRR